MAEVNDLQEVVAYGAARLAVCQMALNLGLLAKFEQAVYVIRYEFLTIRAKHVNHPLLKEDFITATAAVDVQPHAILARH